MLDASTLMLEMARRIEGAALVMRKHEVVRAQQICTCGRVAVRILPMFGVRCEVAGEQWDLVYESMRRLVAEVSHRDVPAEKHPPAVGRPRVR